MRDGHVDDLYEALGVAPTATAAQLRAAFRVLARDLHPDRYPSGWTPEQCDRAAAQWQRALRAWEVLQVEDRRAQYDAVLRERQERRSREVAELRADAGRRADSDARAAAERTRDASTRDAARYAQAQYAIRRMTGDGFAGGPGVFPSVRRSGLSYRSVLDDRCVLGDRSGPRRPLPDGGGPAPAVHGDSGANDERAARPSASADRAASTARRRRLARDAVGVLVGGLLLAAAFFVLAGLGAWLWQAFAS